MDMDILVISIQTITVRQLSEMQRLLIDMYYNDGHTCDFLTDFFYALFPGDEDLIDEYLTEKFAPKLLTFVELPE